LRCDSEENSEFWEGDVNFCITPQNTFLYNSLVSSTFGHSVALQYDMHKRASNVAKNSLYSE
jgi:hypothetical protein